MKLLDCGIHGKSVVVSGNHMIVVRKRNEKFERLLHGLEKGINAVVLV